MRALAPALDVRPEELATLVAGSPAGSGVFSRGKGELEIQRCRDLDHRLKRRVRSLRGEQPTQELRPPPGAPRQLSLAQALLLACVVQLSHDPVDGVDARALALHLAA